MRTERVGQADILVAGHDERASSLRELRRDIAHVPLDHGIAKPRREAAEVKDPGALALDEPESIGGILHRLRRFLVDIGVGGVHSPAQAAAPRPRVVMQLELGGDLLKQLVDTLLFERVDDDQSVSGADEELDLFQKIRRGHGRGKIGSTRRAWRPSQTRFSHAPSRRRAITKEKGNADQAEWLAAVR